MFKLSSEKRICIIKKLIFNKEPPFEPDDIDLKIDFELFKHPLNFDVYEFESTISEEPPMPKFDEKDLRYRKVMTEEGKHNNIILLFYLQT